MKDNFIVIIPARENSKRLPSKNIRLLCGKPLISYTIEYAIKFFEKNRIWVNTDDKKVIKIAKEFDINTYSRKKNLASDTSILSDVILDQCNYLDKINIDFKNIVLLQPTSPFRNKYDLNKMIDIFINRKINSLISVSNFNKKLGKISDNIFLPINYQFEQRSQLINDNYYENGLFYIFSKSLLFNEKKIISNSPYPYIIDGFESIIDIDYDDDFILAELLFKNQLIKV